MPVVARMLALCLALLLLLAPGASAAPVATGGEHLVAVEAGGHGPDSECRNCGPALHCLAVGLPCGHAVAGRAPGEPAVGAIERQLAALERAPPPGPPRTLLA